VGVRREGRELALQLLYALELNPIKLQDMLQLFRENSNVAMEARNFAEELVTGVAANRAAIDKRIVEKSKNWAITRMDKVDLNILRMSVFELMFCDDIPRNVTINEAIEVAKKFGTEDSPSFINGMLDEIANLMPDKP
jgi:N utilization substance protein B